MYFVQSILNALSKVFSPSLFVWCISRYDTIDVCFYRDH